MNDSDRAKEIEHYHKRSKDWLKNNYHPEWKQVFQSYKCEREPYTKPNAASTGIIVDQYNNPINRNYDDSRTSIGMPDTFALVNRGTARMTAQLPNLRFKTADTVLGESISRALMYQWDRGKVQRWQPLHVKQARLFGWSVRAWYWEHGRQKRTRRVDPFNMDVATQEAVSAAYDQAIQGYIAEQSILAVDPATGQPSIDPDLLAARLLQDFGRGGLLPLKYNYQAYSGPASDVLFIGSCFPEPNFQTITSSSWFIVERRRNKVWLRDLAEAYQVENPDIAKNIGELLEEKPKGTPRGHDRDVDLLFRDMQLLINRVDSDTGIAEYETDAKWSITECHFPGEHARIAYVCEGKWIGEIPYPYELDGDIAFTELRFLDDPLSGIGDSHPRIMRGIQQLHDRQRGQSSDLIHALLQPMVWTTSKRLYDNPEQLKRDGGFRLVLVDGPDDIGSIGEQAALAAAAGGLQDESAILRAWQMGTGETNLSQAANIDPAQARTATGARLMAFNQDILTRAELVMLNFSIADDAWMMYKLNRSESRDAIQFDSAPFIRTYNQYQPFPGQQEVTVRPIDWQVDGEIEPEVGSTIADDDDARIHQAQTLWNIAMSNPGAINVGKAAERVLIALGEGRRLQEWKPPQPAPPAPEPPRSSINFAADFSKLDEAIAAQVLEKAGYQVTPQPPQQATPEGAAPRTSPAIDNNGAEELPVDAAAQAAMSYGQ